MSNIIKDYLNEVEDNANKTLKKVKQARDLILIVEMIDETLQPELKKKKERDLFDVIEEIESVSCHPVFRF